MQSRCKGQKLQDRSEQRQIQKEKNNTDSCQCTNIYIWQSVQPACPMSSILSAESFGGESVAYELLEGTSYYENKMPDHIGNPEGENTHVIETLKNVKGSFKKLMMIRY